MHLASSATILNDTTKYALFISFISTVMDLAYCEDEWKTKVSENKLT
jgi:hypothetical protein